MQPKSLSWEIQVSIFRNPLIVKQLLVAVGIPFSLVAAVMILTANADRWMYAFYALSLIGALFLLTALFIYVLYGGKYAVGFVMDIKGIRCYTQTHQAKRNRVVNRLTVVLGLLTGKFSAAGAGMLAQARQEVVMTWRAVQKVKRYPASQTILLSAGYLDNVAVFCTPDNYPAVSELIGTMTGK
ncbi:MAG TPA: hypothetical protein VK905_00240 [Bacillota bacterium]|nr:hypothetical protein [Bacillota bacterium]